MIDTEMCSDITDYYTLILNIHLHSNTMKNNM